MIAVAFLLALGVPVLLLACTVPIYTDEIVWKILQARYFLDHGLVTNGFPQCGPSFLLPPPITHLPARVLDAFLYQDLSHPLKLRAIGVVGMGLLLVLAYRTVRVVVSPVPRRTTTVALVAIFWGLGVMPLLSVLNRPELVILVGVWSLVLGAVVLCRPASPRWLRHEGTRLGVFGTIVVLVLGAHPKTVFFLPVFLVTGWYWLRSRRARSVALALLLVTTAQTVTFNARRYACPNEEGTASLLREVTLQLDDLTVRPATFFAQAGENVLHVPHYFWHLVLAGQYMANWLPDHSRVPVVDDVGDALIYGAVVLVSLGVLLALVSTLRRWQRARRLTPAAAIFLVLLASLAAQVAYQTHKNAYDGAFLLTLGCLALALGWPPHAATRWRRPLRIVFALLTVTTVQSEARLLYHFGPFATHEWLAGGSLPGIVEGTISGFHYDGVNDEVLRVARECGIDVARRPKFVLVDDLTYPALARTTYPLHTMGVSWWGMGISDQYEFLKTLGSEGVVVRCRSLVTALEERTRHYGDLCCLPAFTDSSAPRSTPPAHAAGGTS